jgi:hypothetical protein
MVEKIVGRGETVRRREKGGGGRIPSGVERCLWLESDCPLSGNVAVPETVLL